MNTIRWVAWVTAIAAHFFLAGLAGLWPEERPDTSRDWKVELTADDEILGGFVIGCPGPEPFPEEMDATEGQSGKCEVHHGEMTVVVVPVWYGTPASGFEDEPPGAVRQALFPHHTKDVWGGCCVTEWKRMKVWRCPKCEEAERAWREKR